MSQIPKVPEMSVKWNKEYILAIIKEASELLDELNWKMHVNKDEEDIKASVAIERWGRND